MSISKTDEASLKSFDVLQSYCELHLAPMRRTGNKYACACPWGTHTKPYHMEISAGEHGTGVCYCHACGRGGTVVDVAAALDGLDPRADYAEVLARVAAAVGYSLDTARNGKRRKRVETRRNAHALASGATDHAGGETPTNGLQGADSAPPAAPLWWSAEDEAVAWGLVDNAARNRDAVANVERDLGLPVGSLWVDHTTPDDGLDCMGLIGLDDLGRLLYVYTMRDDAGKPRPVMVKLRRRAVGSNPALMIDNGKLLSGREMPGRFCSLKKGGVPCLYGADAISTHKHIILTEGESDKLALDASIAALREAHQTGIDSPDEYLSEENVPVAVAKAGAGCFKPEWLDSLRGRAVTVACDADDAGRRGAEKTLAELHRAGIAPLFLWCPDDTAAAAGKKDVRSLLNAGDPLALILAILTQKRKWKHN